MSLEHDLAQQRLAGPPAAYTVDEFCTAHRISRGLLYKLWREGKGPRFFLAGTKRRISNEAARDWRGEGENDAA
jgi:hypothetical protein